jgi:4-amino-4-deoxy-L-arabinose transferase-like glycosyltransferase
MMGRMKATSTTDRPAALVDAPPRPRAALVALAPILLALAALLPRLLGLADFLTTDEAYHWITRTERFAAAVAAGRWADTILTGHPGVTLMWLGTLGLRLEQLAVGAGWAASPDRLGHLAWLRLGPVLAHTLIVPVGYLLLRRLVRPALALAAALLWATSPFLVAHGRLLHLDALLTGLCTLVLLSVLVACRAARPLPWLLLAGALCGLALLTKGPALIVLPFVGLAMFALGGATVGPRWALDKGARGLLASALRQLRWSVPRYLLILAVAAAVVVALWPALWAAPGQAIGRYVGEIVGNGGRPNGDGQFFLGSSDPDPGPLFYPAAALFRLTPLELLGLLCALGFAVGARQKAKGQRQPQGEADDGARSGASVERTTLIALALFCLWWLLVMTAGPKKFDRYILPLWPALLTLSAYGLVRGWEWLTRQRPVRFLPVAFCLLLPQAAVLAWYHPHYLSYYSPLLGGGPVAQRTFLIGWGEGMERVGAALRARPNLGDGQVLSALPPTLQPFVPVPVREVATIDAAPANYAVVYLESLQRGDAPELYARIRETVPIDTVRIHGIEYAWIHQLAKPFATPVGAEFGGALRLRGYTAEIAGGQLVVTPSWDVRAVPPGDLLLFLHLLDASGQRVAGVDVPPGGASLPPTSRWLPGEQIAVPLPVDLPAGLPPGSYTLTMGLYRPDTFERLPLTAGPAADAVAAGPNAALLGEVLIP